MRTKIGSVSAVDWLQHWPVALPPHCGRMSAHFQARTASRCSGNVFAKRPLSATHRTPYWRLLCAWRVYDGIQHLRGQIQKQARHLKITEPMPKDPEISLDRLREAGLPDDFLKGIKRTADLFKRFKKMRDGVAHFILKEGTHVYFSDGRAYSDYSVASTVLLHAATTAIRELLNYYSRTIERKTRIGSILPERHHAEKFFVRDPQLSVPLSEAAFKPKG